MPAQGYDLITIGGRNPVQAQCYDLITIGGGIAASALAKAMAERGAKVLLLERELNFKDRVRGEGLVCWGGGEARELGPAARLGGNRVYRDYSELGARGLRQFHTL